MAGCWSLKSELTTGPRLTGSDQSENWPKWRGRQRFCSCSSARTNLSAATRVQRAKQRKGKQKSWFFETCSTSFIRLEIDAVAQGRLVLIGFVPTEFVSIQLRNASSCLWMRSEFVSGFRFPKEQKCRFAIFLPRSSLRTTSLFE